MPSLSPVFRLDCSWPARSHPHGPRDCAAWRPAGVGHRVGSAGIGAAHHRQRANYIWYFAGWTVLGAGMGAGLYDAAFASLGALYGKAAGGAIASVTLFGGFASTVCWPASAYLVDHVGWRSTCLVYAAIHLVVALPSILQFCRAKADWEQAPPYQVIGSAALHHESSFSGMLSAVLTISAAILSMMGAQLIALFRRAALISKQRLPSAC